MRRMGETTIAVLIVVILRVVFPLAILRWPLAGGLLAMVVDAFDVVLVDAIAYAIGQASEFGPFYAQTDKYFDTYYLLLELVVLRRWPESLPRRAATALFLWRLVGVIAFEVTGYRELLLVFPNLFENFYLYVLIVRRWTPSLMPRTFTQVVAVLVVLLVPKLAQEWILHVERAHPWFWFRQHFIEPVLGL